MDAFTIGMMGVGLLLFLLIAGVHIGFSLSIAGFISMYLITSRFGPAVELVVSSFYYKVTLPSLVTVPLFILMGFLASGGGISQNIYKSLRLWLGKYKSGLGIATVFACTAFGTVCGSSLVTSAVFAKISAPEMRKCGYDKKLAYAICASAGAIGMLIPPSILAIIYGILSGESIGKILMAGVVPGLLLTLVFSITIVIIGKLKPSLIGATATDAEMEIPQEDLWPERFRSLKDWWSIAIVAVVIFGGLYGGIFSPSEASAFSAFILLVIFLSVTLFKRERRSTVPKDLLSMFRETAVTSAMIFFVMGGAAVFGKSITMAGLTTRLSAYVVDSGLSNMAIVLILISLVGVLGCFLDSTSILCVTIPVFNPIIHAAGINPIWFATVNILAIEVGLITPPFGLNVFATKGAAEADVRLEDVFGGVLPFFFSMLLVLVLLLVVPSISTYLPSFVE